MKFYINKIILWLKNGKQRELKFENNKINIITGNSKTGKTAILQIIDYCLFGSESNISHAIIGDNVLWYGLNFSINKKNYTIARGKYKSNNYYFSADGEIPKLPSASLDEKSIKNIIEQEFSLNNDIKLNTGSRSIKNDSSLSFRFFLLFNTLSGNIINDEYFYFDKQNLERYRIAMSPTFDLATGITTIDDILISNKIKEIEKNLYKLNKEREEITQNIENKDAKIKSIINKAISVKLLENDDDIKVCIEKLKKLISTTNLALTPNFYDNEIMDRLKLKRQEILIQLNKLKKFQKSYERYKKSLEEQSDAIKPIKYFQKEFSNRIINEEYKLFLNMIENNLSDIKLTIKEKFPFECEVTKKISKLKEELKNIEKDIELMPQALEIPISDKERLIALGEIKNIFNKLINQDINLEPINKKISSLEKEYNTNFSKLLPIENRRNLIVQELNSYIQSYINDSKDALSEYGDYIAYFDYLTKSLKLVKPKGKTENVTSSSDLLFTHLCMFLGLHEMFLDKNTPFVLPYLIIDQATRPYFNNGDNIVENSEQLEKSEDYLKSKDDWAKVLNIFKLIDTFFDNIKKNGHNFQIILLEHVPPSAWKDSKHVNLVEIFDGKINALIPVEDIS